MRRPLLTACLLIAPLLGPLAAFAQAPPAVPALPDTERRTAYSISANTCACNVNFALYGDGTDIDEWLQVWVAGIRYLSTDPLHGWSLSSATGSLATIPRPITDAVLTFNAPQTGTVQIVGARRPRQLTQFTENRGVAARDLNQRLTDITAIERELWDKTNDLTGRGLFGLPGESIATMPSAAARAGKFLYFDATGLIPQFISGVGTGNVVGPPSSTVGDFATWNNTLGELLADQTSIESKQNIYFGGRPTCNPITYGAVPDGVTNNLAAFNSCLTALGSNGGTIWLDNVPGTGSLYCLKAASQGGIFNLNVPVRLVFSSPNVVISSCGSGFSALKISSPSLIEGAKGQILGPGMDGASAFGASNPAIILASGAGGSVLKDLNIYGGAPTIQWNCGECQALNVEAGYSFVSTIATATWFFQNGGGELWNVASDDNEYPQGIPSAPFTYTAWATSQSVATNAVRTATCQDGNSYVIQAKVGGTTANAGTGPSCKNYGIAFTDGTVTWLLSHPTQLNKWQFDTGTADVHIHRADTGGGNVGIALTNTLSGNAPIAITCVDCNGGNSYFTQVDGKVGNTQINFVSDNFAGCLETGCYVMTFESTFTGGVTITGGEAFEGQNGISIAGGTGYSITGVNLTGGTQALSVSGSASHVTAIGNNVTGVSVGLSVAGTASEIIFTGNAGCVNGTSVVCVQNTSSGSNIITAPNDDGNAFGVLVGTTNVNNGVAGCILRQGTSGNTTVKCDGNATVDSAGNTTIAGQITGRNGSATGPTITGATSTNTGFYFPGASQWGFAASGTLEVDCGITTAATCTSLWPWVISGGINGSPIGATTPSTGKFTSLQDTGLSTQGVVCNDASGNLSTATTGCANVTQSVPHGGSGAATLTGILVGNGTSAFTATQVTGAVKDNGSGTLSQAACADLSNGVASCSTDTTNASNISSGTLGAARLPNPTASTLGGIESLAAVSHNWINQISTSGVPSATQPAIGDISGWGTGVATALGNATNATGGPVTATAACQAWTPTDQSGASLTFTSVSTQYCQYGNLVYAYGTLTYPSTANGSNAVISLPVAVPNQAYAVVYSTKAVDVSNIVLQTVKNTSTAAFILGAAGTAVTNASLSTAVVNFLIIYPAS